MPLEIVTIPCRSDNYAFLAHAPESDVTALIDAPAAAPIEAELTARGWSLDMILITHHHGDHVEGVDALRDKYDADVLGGAADAHRLPALDRELNDGDTLSIGDETGTVLDVSGHTVGHLAFHFPGSNAVFTADSLMALGCGRVFEGTPAQMWESLVKLRGLPDNTIVYSGHEYTANNARFALTIEPDNPALIERAREVEITRAKNRPTVPSRLAVERDTNPFLRADLAEVKAGLGMSAASDVDVFAEIRARKDRF